MPTGQNFFFVYHQLRWPLLGFIGLLQGCAIIIALFALRYLFAWGLFIFVFHHTSRWLANLAPLGLLHFGRGDHH